MKPKRPTSITSVLVLFILQSISFTFFTYFLSSKYDADITGLDGLQAVCESTHIPVVSIGGVNKDNCHESIEHGASILLFQSLMALVGIAVISAIFGQKDVKKASKDLYDAVMTSLEENHKL